MIFDEYNKTITFPTHEGKAKTFRILPFVPKGYKEIRILEDCTYKFYHNAENNDFIAVLKG